MEKQIQTVYVGTMEDTTLHLAKRKGEWNALNSSMNLCHSLKEVRAYLYTHEEHAAVQGYREALEEIIYHCKSRKQGIPMAKLLQRIEQGAEIALSKAEDKGDNGWISVEDRLPEVGEDVLVVVENGWTIMMGKYNPQGWERYYSNCGIASERDDPNKVTHWQPLPPKP